MKCTAIPSRRLFTTRARRKENPRRWCDMNGRGFLGRLRGAETPPALSKFIPPSATAQKKTPAEAGAMRHHMSTHYFSVSSPSLGGSGVSGEPVSSFQRIFRTTDSRVENGPHPPEQTGSSLWPSAPSVPSRLPRYCLEVFRA